MSLENKFQVNVGDLVLFSSMFDGVADLSGYVVGYSGKKVKLTNRAIQFRNGEFRRVGFFVRQPNEKRYSTDLDIWDSYEVLKKVKVE